MKFVAHVNKNLVLFSPTADMNMFGDLKEILVAIRFVENIGSKRLRDHMKICLVPLEQQKVIKKRFTPENVNSGVCFSNGGIVIWRREELKKVLIHELVHLLEIDFYGHDEPLRRFTRGVFDLAPHAPLFPNEATTESIAIIIVSFLNTKWGGRHDSLHQELKWALKQAAKVMRHLKEPFDYESDVVSYYVTKSFLLMQACRYPESLQALFRGTHLFPNKTYSPAEAMDILVTRLQNLAFWDHYQRALHEAGVDSTPTLRMSLLTG